MRYHAFMCIAVQSYGYAFICVSIQCVAQSPLGLQYPSRCMRCIKARYLFAWSLKVVRSGCTLKIWMKKKVKTMSKTSKRKKKKKNQNRKLSKKNSWFSTIFDFCLFCCFTYKYWRRIYFCFRVDLQCIIYYDDEWKWLALRILFVDGFGVCGVSNLTCSSNIRYDTRGRSYSLLGLLLPQIYHWLGIRDDANTYGVT